MPRQFDPNKIKSEFRRELRLRYEQHNTSGKGAKIRHEDLYQTIFPNQVVGDQGIHHALYQGKRRIVLEPDAFLNLVQSLRYSFNNHLEENIEAALNWYRKSDTPYSSNILLEIRHRLEHFFIGENVEELVPSPVLEVKPAKVAPLDDLFDLSTPGSYIRADSRTYIKRIGVSTAVATIREKGQTIIIKGLHQSGKTSLLHHLLDEAQKVGKLFVKLNIRIFDDAVLFNANKFFPAFCNSLQEELEVGFDIESLWQPKLGNIQNSKRFVRLLLEKVENPLVIAIDEVDRLFRTDYYNEFFGMLRNWHEDRIANPWKRLDLILSTSTEPYYFIKDLSKSPFMVGLECKLKDFNLKEVSELNLRYDSPFSSDEVSKLANLLGGHPFLTHLAIFQVKRGNVSSDEIFNQAISETGPFAQHLHYHLTGLEHAEELRRGLKQILEGENCAHRVGILLQDAGLIREEGDRFVMRCQLYTRYFLKHSF